MTTQRYTVPSCRLFVALVFATTTIQLWETTVDGFRMMPIPQKACRRHPTSLFSALDDDDANSSNPLYHVSRTAFLATTLIQIPAAAALAFDGGVGGLGKTKPQTGVELFEEPIQNEQGIVSSEIKGVDGSPIRISFRTPWPLLPTSGALEARDIRSTESAFCQVTSSKKNWETKAVFSKILEESVFAAQGKFGAYGQPFDVSVKKLDSGDETKALFSVGFTTLTPAMRESERRALVVAQSVGATLILLVVTTTSARYASNEKVFRSVTASFEAIAAPQSGLKRTAVAVVSSK